LIQILSSQKNEGNPESNYIKGAKLGEGAFGEVWSVKHKLTSAPRAMKILKKTLKEPKEIQDSVDILNEINLLKKIDHPNIVKIYEFYNLPDRFCLLTELCSEGELFQEIDKNDGPFKESDVAFIMFQLFSAVFYCHNLNIIHRDLKPENILIEKREKNGLLRVKIIDFGTAKICEKGRVEKKIIGSSYYIAPEVLAKNYNQKCDLWSCGVIMFILLSGRAPFSGETDEEIINKIKIGTYDLKRSPWNTISKEAISLIQGLLQKDPNQRLTAEEALNSPWFKNLKTKEKLNELKVMKNEAKFIQNLKSYHPAKLLQVATLAYLVHNFNQLEEVQEASKLFNKFDLNGDGKISKDELSKGIKSTIQISNEKLEEDVNNIFKALDTDNSGFIDFEEFVRAAIDKEKLLNEQTLKFAFQFFDKDGNGDITRDSIKNVFFPNINKNDVRESRLQSIIKDVDTNGDGKISFQEFSSVMRNILLE